MTTIMYLPNGFKIRKKSDAACFINECMIAGCTYFLKITEDFALFFEKDKNGTVTVLEKRWDLYNPFNPLLTVADTSNNIYENTVDDYVWKYRKYINAYWFNGKE